MSATAVGVRNIFLKKNEIYFLYLKIHLKRKECVCQRADPCLLARRFVCVWKQTVCIFLCFEILIFVLSLLCDGRLCLF